MTDRVAPPQAEKNVCPECGSTRLARDYALGEVVCTRCGLVVQDRMMDYGPEWRAFDEEQREKRTRVGPPTTLTMHDKGLTTTIDWQDRDSHDKDLTPERRAQMYRLRKWQHRIRVSDAAERNLAFALSQIDRMASQLSLPKSAREATALIYRRAKEKKAIRGRSIEGMVAAALYAACKERGIPRTLDDIARASGASKTEVDRNYRFIARKLSMHTELTPPAEYVPKIASELGLDGETQTKATELAEECERRGLARAYNPVGVAAAAVYAASALRAKKIAKTLTKNELRVLRFLMDTERARLADIEKARHMPGRAAREALAGLTKEGLVERKGQFYRRTGRAEKLLRKVTQHDVADAANLTEVTVRHMVKKICGGLGIELPLPKTAAKRPGAKERTPPGVQNIVVSVEWKGTELNLEDLSKRLEKDGTFWDVKYDRREFPGMTLKLKEPPGASFLLFESGRANCVGTKSMRDAREAIAALTRALRRAGLRVPEPRAEVQNIIFTFDTGREFDIDKIARTYRGAEYNPESFPGATLKLVDPKATVLIFASGRGVCTGTRSVADAKRAVNRLKDQLLS
jgi:transcription initiation factor TFIIB